MGDYVNLNEVGALSRSGQGYDTTADDNVSESRNFTGRMDASQQGLRGNAGTTFTNVATQHGANLVQLANLLAGQAARAVLGERTVINADLDADTAQSTTMSAVETQSTAVSRPINV